MPQHDDLLPSDVEAITTGLLRLSQQIDRAERPADFADVLAPIVDRHDGALRRIAQIFEAIANACNDFVLQDSYAMELQDISDEAFSQVTNLIDYINGFDKQFRTFSADVIRTPTGERRPTVSSPAAPNPTLGAPTTHRVRMATETLADLAAYLRTYPSLDQALPLLATLLDENEGAPILLGDILRTSTRIVSQRFAHPRSDDVHQAIEAFRDAAREATDMHVLHWDVQRLHTQTGTPGR